MRKRLTQEQRKSDILMHAGLLFRQNGYADTEMEDIRNACGISRGGLYHHFGSKGAILDAIVAQEVAELVDVLERSDNPPIETLLEAGSSQLGKDPGIVAALSSIDEKLVYLSSLDRAVAHQLSPVLSAKMQSFVRSGVDSGHVAELFLTINAHINRRVFLGDWTNEQGTGFAATALEALVPFLKDATRLHQIIQALNIEGYEK